MGIVYQHEVNVTFDMSDINGNMKLPQLIRLSLQVSGFHSQKLGISDDYLYENYQLVWIVTDYEITIHQMPIFNQDIIIETEALSYNRLFCYRRFTILDKAGKLLVEMIASFAMMNRELRKVQSVVEEVVEPYGADFSKKIHRGPRYQELTNPKEIKYPIRFYDLDMNGHVNNSSYLEWIFEVMGTDFLKHHIPKKIHLKYVKEVVSGGDIVSKYEFSENESNHQIVSDGSINAQAKIKWRTTKSNDSTKNKKDEKDEI
ncbi:Acyl-ACP thioesterase [Streptococcus sp. DD10]|uniref:acyl-[acyl-carrier-protein] thioesterase n=1 Tax=Streptococcus sp. DD10 TaxID=1777878 RepID=UPI00079116B9|nr:acyl-[acyl-carrier-protein] thioesterase [Streptococcus sp. DD10]KXT73359.1 Acyl-ACP thioesterase [Streptococcus sp. DD10]